jgi:hypothetical protein
MLDQRWVNALEQADETGDLRPLLELLLTQRLPDWMIEELAHLFTWRRLNVSKSRSLSPRVAMALAEYREMRTSGRSARERVEAVVEKYRLSEKEEATLHNMITGKGRPSSRYTREDRLTNAAFEFEKSLRALLNAYPNSQR